MVDAEFTDLVRGFLGERMKTSTRLYLFKFVYAYTRDVGILHEAMKWKSSKIHEWAQAQLGGKA